MAEGSSNPGKSEGQGLLLVVAGPSGVGKGSMIAGVRERYPDLQVSVSCTTRRPRPGEVDGRDYHFVTPEQFDMLREGGQLLEWAVVHRNLSYGTPRRPVEEALCQGEDLILEIDYQGARSVREALGDRAVLVFVAPPSWQALRQRLILRHTERPEEVARRLESARREIDHMGMFQYVIINDDLSEAVAELEALLVTERHRLRRFDWQTLRDRLLAEADEDANEETEPPTAGEAGLNPTRSGTIHTQRRPDHTGGQPRHTHRGPDHTQVDAGHTQAEGKPTRPDAKRTQGGEEHARA